MASLKAFRVVRAGYPLGNQPLEVLIFGGVAVLLVALASVLPTVGIAVFATRPNADTWAFNLFALPILSAVLLIAFSRLLESEPGVGSWLVSVACILGPRVLIIKLRPGHLMYASAA